MNAPLFAETEYCQQVKHRQSICGDVFLPQRFDQGNRIISVLSDGLGSGVKANVLASMTATMALRFVASDMEILRSSEIIMDALPVCRERKISYSTFTILDIRLDGATRIIEMDNPPFFLIRDGQIVETNYETVTSPRWKERSIRIHTFSMQPEDRLVCFSDGINQAGMGSVDYPLGWQVEGCKQFILETLEVQPDISASQLAKSVLQEALEKEPSRNAGDDMTCAVIYLRKPRKMLVVTGPPYDETMDDEYASVLKSFDGKKVICGGTSADIIERELKLRSFMPLKNQEFNAPPISRMENIDLVTEGILTLTQTAKILEEKALPRQNDAPSALANLLLESDLIHFLVGTRINPAHQDPSLPVDLEIRRNIVKRISNILRKHYLKETKIQYI